MWLLLLSLIGDEIRRQVSGASTTLCLGFLRVLLLQALRGVLDDDVGVLHNEVVIRADV